MTTKTCTIDGCERGGKLRRGLCGMHWQRFRKHGDPLGGRAEMFGEFAGAA